MASSELLFCQTRDTDGRWEGADGSVRELRLGVQSDALGALGLGWLGVQSGALVVRMATAGRDG